MNIFTHIFLFGLYSLLLTYGYKLLNIFIPILNSDYNDIKPAQVLRVFKCIKIPVFLLFYNRCIILII